VSKSRLKSIEYESPVCPFCEIPITDRESILAGICAACREVIHEDQCVAWDSRGERLCNGAELLNSTASGRWRLLR
jgi:hypothetical protein